MFDAVDINGKGFIKYEDFVHAAVDYEKVLSRDKVKKTF